MSVRFMQTWVHVRGCNKRRAKPRLDRRRTELLLRINRTGALGCSSNRMAAASKPCRRSRLFGGNLSTWSEIGGRLEQTYQTVAAVHRETRAATIAGLEAEFMARLARLEPEDRVEFVKMLNTAIGLLRPRGRLQWST